jgi:hypothetical protein
VRFHRLLNDSISCRRLQLADTYHHTGSRKSTLFSKTRSRPSNGFKLPTTAVRSGCRISLSIPYSTATARISASRIYCAASTCCISAAVPRASPARRKDIQVSRIFSGSSAVLRKYAYAHARKPMSTRDAVHLSTALLRPRLPSAFSAMEPGIVPGPITAARLRSCRSCLFDGLFVLPRLLGRDVATHPTSTGDAVLVIEVKVTTADEPPMLNSARHRLGRSDRRPGIERLQFRARVICRRCALDASYESVGNAGSIGVTTTDKPLRTDSIKRCKG